MTEAMKSVYSTLSGLGLYRLEQGSLVDCELMAYEAAFSVLEDILAETRRRSFIQTAEGEGLAAHERLVGLGVRDIPVENRRELVIYRLSVAPLDFTAEGIVRSMKAAGVDAELKENYPQESLTVTSNLFIDQFDDLDSLKARLSEMLPAHLDWEFDTGFLTWDMFDAKGLNWDQWDSRDFTWDEFDIDGHNIL